MRKEREIIRTKKQPKMDKKYEQTWVRKASKKCLKNLRKRGLKCRIHCDLSSFWDQPDSTEPTRPTDPKIGQEGAVRNVAKDS
jgi:hypothetical protein